MLPGAHSAETATQDTGGSAPALSGASPGVVTAGALVALASADWGYVSSVANLLSRAQKLAEVREHGAVI